ncbi:unnamed protein product [Brachionus calyciflorus]|uniref:PX domain-containing protein n=1 Tax=Brachionus calyciflorus TaxID=104777 RepID=A0A814MSR8_9BILA|nr:unnamed protein product [Brachionus calyciflorus]
MEHMHLVVNLANESSNRQASSIPNTGIYIKINKALLISKRQNIFLNEEYYKYAIEMKVNGEYWVIFRRFSEIREEHERMCKNCPNLRKEPFPPRSPFTKTDSFQIERQQKLEAYLKNYIQIVLGETIFLYMPHVKAPGQSDQTIKLTKSHFCDKLNFFQETTEDKLNVQKLGWKSFDV